MALKLYRGWRSHAKEFVKMMIWLLNLLYLLLSVDKATHPLGMALQWFLLFLIYPSFKKLNIERDRERVGEGGIFLRLHLSFAVPHSPLAFVVRHSPIPEIVGGMLGHPRVRKSSGCVRSD